MALLIKVYNILNKETHHVLLRTFQFLLLEGLIPARHRLVWRIFVSCTPVTRWTFEIKHLPNPRAHRFVSCLIQAVSASSSLQMSWERLLNFMLYFH